MNKFTIFFLALTLFTAAACKTETHSNHNAQTAATPEVLETGKAIVTENGVYTIDLKTNPTAPKAGEKTTLSFEIKNPQNEIVRDFEIVHEKPMHLLIVSRDLEEFYHLHPEVQADGLFKTDFTFPNGGDYEVYADFTLKNLPQAVQNFSVKVSGNERAAVELKPDAKFEKTVEGLRVVMKPDGELVSGEERMLEFQVFDAANKPVTDLENYLGAKAHFVIISKDLQEFVHAHPMSDENVKTDDHSHGAHEHGATNHSEKTEKPEKAEKTQRMAGADAASIVSAHVAFPKASTYKIWAQFQRGGKVITVPFTVDVKAGSKEKGVDTSKVSVPEGALKIVVSKDGFAPQEIYFKKGQPLKLAFYRADAENCASEVVFKNLNLTKKLPVGEVTLVDIPTDKAGEINFACGMDMYQGKIVIQ